MSSPVIHRSRQVTNLVRGEPTRDGAGVRLMRVLTPEWQLRLDPFLMLDHFASDDPNDYIAGFPDHPHRGFETVTYMVAGRLRHRDSAGHEGLLQSGGVQWMTAGRGLIHSEMPEQINGRMEGFQLWLNLPGRDKMCPPAYRDIPSEAIPEFQTAEGVRARVIAGQSHGVDGAVHRDPAAWPTDVLYLDLHFPSDGAPFEQPLLESHNAFVYVYRGQVEVGGTEVPTLQMAVLSNHGDGVRLQGRPDFDGARALLVAGRPLREPIVQYGPFVMNSREEVLQAVHDYQSGRLG